MPAFKDLTGKRFGRLLIESSGPRRCTRTTWKCLCNCGRRKIIFGNALVQGLTKSCGCLLKERYKELSIDFTGKRLGRLTVLSRSKKRARNREIIWNCKCDCGRKTAVVSDSLRRGHTKSCGCLAAETRILNGKMPNSRINLSGRRYGYLMVLEFSHTDKKTAFWKCLCDCGAETIVRSQSLLRKKQPTKSCGCLLSATMIAARSKSLDIKDIPLSYASTVKACNRLKKEIWKP